MCTHIHIHNIIIYIDTHIHTESSAGIVCEDIYINECFLITCCRIVTVGEIELIYKAASMAMGPWVIGI